MKTIDLDILATVIGGAGGTFKAPLSGDVNQINNGWGGTVNSTVNVYNQAPAPKPPTTRIEYLRQHPEARWGPPPFKPMPLRPFGR